MAKKSNIRISSIEIKSYRGIDYFRIIFPIGKMASEPDVNILGSKNGVGKTSVLECCAWVLLAATYGEDAFNETEFDFSDIVKSGDTQSIINANISVGDDNFNTIVKIAKSGHVETSGIIAPFGGTRSKISYRATDGIVGMYPDPVVGRNFLFLHSYRKMQEGRPEFGMLMDDDEAATLRRRVPYRYIDRGQPFSLFKRLIVRHLMERANLFDKNALKAVGRDREAIEVLNKLLMEYADVRIGKLRPFRNNTIDVQVEKLDDQEHSFSIDGLSSGQKEVISTLFLVWYSTYKSPSVVLIDEPELHLNMQWHRNFVDKLLELSPGNQYIIATHAEDIMESVDIGYRHLLFP